MTKIDINFKCNYQWEILNSLPENRIINNYPPELPDYYVGFIVEVKPDFGISWIGNFKFSGLNFPSRILPTPNENQICIIADGAGYCVNTLMPDDFLKIPIIPIIDVISSLDQGFLLFFDFNKIAVLDSMGLRWVVKVSKDGIKVTKITKEKIMGLAWDPAKGREVKFEINTQTGEAKGGSHY